MARPRQVKAVFYLPVIDNDGADPSRELAEVEERCYLAFGAWTKMGHFKGVWRMQTGERRLDTSAVYAVVLDERRVPELERILRDFTTRTMQEAIYLEVEHDVDVRMIRRERGR